MGKQQQDGMGLHNIFAQYTMDSTHKIFTKGLDQVRDAIPSNPIRVRIHDHHALVWLMNDDINIEGYLRRGES